MKTTTRPPGADPARPPPRAWTPLAVAVLVVAAVGVAHVSGLPDGLTWGDLHGRLDRLRGLVRRDRPAALAVFFAAYVAAAALSLPFGSVLSLAAGALFGRWVGTVVVSVASTLGATLAMLASRHLLRDRVRGRFGGRLRAIDEGFGRDGPYYLFALRLVPAVPFVLVNLGMGLTRMRALPFALVSLAGMLPATFLYVNAGAELARVDAPGRVLSPRVLASLALLGVMPLAVRLLARRKR